MGWNEPSVVVQEYHTSTDPGGSMPNPSLEIIMLVLVFATAFTTPTFAKALILLYGTILAAGR
jgi:hypothetical protein